MASLDYAVNRSYSSGQGRFTTVDPIGMSASSLGNPQSLNLYSYTQNNPVDFTDPSGLNRQLPGSGSGQRGMLYTLYYGHSGDWTALFSWFVPYGDGGGDDEGGSGGNGGHESGHQQATPAKDPDGKTFQNCLDKTFGKGLVGISVQSTDGKTTIVMNFTYNDKPFSVTTYLTRATSYELGRRMYGQNTSERQSGLAIGGQEGNNIETDIADEITPGVNSGKYTQVGFNALLWHEVGNGIAVYLNMNAKGKKMDSGWGTPTDPPDNDSDAGTAFERCLYGGIVSLGTGNLGNSRAFEW